MGLVHPGIPKELALELKSQFNLDTFIETGTYYGATAAWGASYFREVLTIEFAKPIYDQAVKTHSALKNVNFIFGHSREELPKIARTLEQPALFWLDGHWSLGGTYGENDECPVLDEIRAILQSPCSHFVLIDDARLFLAPPPSPLHIEQWPTVKTIIETLNSTDKSYSVFIYDDIIVAVPAMAEEKVATYLQKVISAQWSAYLSPTRRGFNTVRDGLNLMYRGMLVKVRKFVPDPFVRAAKSLLKPSA